MLVNGRPILQSLLRSRKGEGDDREDRAPNYLLDIRTDGERDTLQVGETDSLWIYAKVTCDKPEVDTAALTRSIGFDASGPNAGWLVLGPTQAIDDFKAIRLRARSPGADASLADGGADVVASVTIDGNTFNGPVHVELIPEHEVVFV